MEDHTPICQVSVTQGDQIIGLRKIRHLNFTPVQKVYEKARYFDRFHIFRFHSGLRCGHLAHLIVQNTQHTQISRKIEYLVFMQASCLCCSVVPSTCLEQCSHKPLSKGRGVVT